MELQQHIQRKEEDCVKREDESKGERKERKRGGGGNVESSKVWRGEKDWRGKKWLEETKRR